MVLISDNSPIWLPLRWKLTSPVRLLALSCSEVSLPSRWLVFQEAKASTVGGAHNAYTTYPYFGFHRQEKAL